MIANVLLVGAIGVLTPLVPGQAGGTMPGLPRPGPALPAPVLPATDPAPDITRIKSYGGTDRQVGAAIYDDVTAAESFCAKVPGDYRIDCLADRLKTIAAAIPAGTPYSGDTRAALARAAADLDRVARDSYDRARPARSFQTGGARPQASGRALRPVAAARKVAALGRSVAILEEAQTLLLRSSRTQPVAGPQIARIAAAVGSNKLLLRSA
jgi:hypothetical protein